MLKHVFILNFKFLKPLNFINLRINNPYYIINNLKWFNDYKFKDNMGLVYIVGGNLKP